MAMPQRDHFRAFRWVERSKTSRISWSSSGQAARPFGSWVPDLNGGALADQLIRLQHNRMANDPVRWLPTEDFRPRLEEHLAAVEAELGEGDS